MFEMNLTEDEHYIPLEFNEMVKGDDGFSPTIEVEPIENGHKVTITDASGTRTFDVMNGQDADVGMKFYKVDYNGGQNITHDGVVLTYNDLVEKYNDPKWFLYAEANQLTMIPSLPPVETDPIIEFSCSWIYEGESRISRLIINNLNQVKFENYSLATKSDVKVNDVKINGTSILTNGVADIPIATSNSVGLVRANGTYGVALGSNGNLTIARAGDTYIDSRNSGYLPIVPSTLDYAVKQAMCDGKGAEWSDVEKANARKRMGLGDYELIVDNVTIGESTELALFDLGKDYDNVRIKLVLPPDSNPSSYCLLGFKVDDDTEPLSMYLGFHTIYYAYYDFESIVSKGLRSTQFSWRGNMQVNTTTNINSNSSTIYLSRKEIGKIKSVVIRKGSIDVPAGVIVSVYAC